MTRSLTVARVRQRLEECPEGDAGALVMLVVRGDGSAETQSS